MLGGEMSKTYLILDTNYLCYRSRYAMGSELSYRGSPTTIIYSFLKTLIALQEQFRTSRLLFCFDSKSSLRKKIYPQYKEKRHSKELTDDELEFEKAFRSQVKKLREIYLPKIGYRNIYQAPGFESDDLIARLAMTIAGLAKRSEDKAVIITADHDLYQMISPNVSVYNPSSGKELTLQGLKKSLGISPRQWTLVKTIAGCPTDGVSGIKGVGEKTAIKYIKDELKTTSKAWKSIKSKEGQTIIERNFQLVWLPFPNTPTLEIREDHLSLTGWKSVCKQLGMRSIEHENPFPWRKLK